jgi:glycosyltransferase involved in cell wall biosynthesis
MKKINNNKKRIFILMPAYNVQFIVENTLARIPKDVWKNIFKLVIVNDGSSDGTKVVLKKLAKKYKKIVLIDKKINQGYAKAQKTGFDYCLKNNADIVALLHSDGQYAPELIWKLLTPLVNDKADIVQGSRILGGGALLGKMPLYKYVANRILSTLENLVFGMNMGEYHSGYMLYSKEALNKIPYTKLSDTFHIDGEMLIVGHDMKLRIKEVSIPTHYGEEKSNLKPIKYGIDVLKIMFDYKMGKYNFAN